MSTASRDVHVLSDTLQCEPVLLKSECSLNGNCLMAEADDSDISAGPSRKNSITTFEAFTSLHCDMADGVIQTKTLIALQIRVNKTTFFLCPKKPKRHKNTIKLKRKKINLDKVFDKKDSEIEGKYRKYWFQLKSAENGSHVYESLAYSGFFISVEGSDVLMRQCDQGIPTERNYHIQTFPAFKSKFKVEERTLGTKPLNLQRDIPAVRITDDRNCEHEVDPAVSEDLISGRSSATPPSLPPRENAISRTVTETTASPNAVEVLVAHGNMNILPPGNFANNSSKPLAFPAMDDISVTESSLVVNGNTSTVLSPGSSTSSKTETLGAEVVDESGLNVKNPHEKLNFQDISNGDKPNSAVDNNFAQISKPASPENSGQGSLATDTARSPSKNENVDQKSGTLNSDKNKSLIDQDVRTRSGRLNSRNNGRLSFLSELFSCVSSRGNTTD